MSAEIVSPREGGFAEPVCHVHALPAVGHGGERRTRWVIALTAVTMVAEIAAGTLSGSLALTADGWHMLTHVGALGLSAAAYWYARTRAGETRFAFGTGKVYALAGYTSAGLLALVALSMLASAAERLLAPRSVDFAEALPVAVIGLVVNLVSAWLLHEDEDRTEAGPPVGAVGAGDGGVSRASPGRSHPAQAHSHSHGHAHAHRHDHEGESSPGHALAERSAPMARGDDHNLRAVYLHVISDALTSVAAIVALVAGRYQGWGWVDPIVAGLGGVLVLRWSAGLLTESARQLVDQSPSTAMRDQVHRALGALESTRVEDLHLWRVGPASLVCVVSLSTSKPLALDRYKEIIRAAAPVDHLTIEICTRVDAGGP